MRENTLPTHQKLRMDYDCARSRITFPHCALIHFRASSVLVFPWMTGSVYQDDTYLCVRYGRKSPLNSDGNDA